MTIIFSVARFASVQNNLRTSVWYRTYVQLNLHRLEDKKDNDDDKRNSDNGIQMERIWQDVLTCPENI